MKTNTMLVPETLTPLADADLQKWCERKCAAQVLRRITRDDNRRASVARNSRQKIVDGNLKEAWSLAVASGFRCFICRAPVEGIDEYMPDMASRLADKTFDSLFAYPNNERIALDVPNLTVLQDAVKEIKTALKQKSNLNPVVSIESSRSRLFVCAPPKHDGRGHVCIDLSSMPCTDRQTYETKYHADVVRLNADYLADALALFPDARFFARRNKPEISGVLVESEFGKGVVMPVRK